MNNKVTSFVPAAAFLLLTFLGAVLFFALPKDDFSETEKRSLASAPEFSAEKLIDGSFRKAVDGDSDKGDTGYVSDHFPFRTTFVGLNAYANLAVGTTADSDYYFCRDGYIITKPASTDNLTKNIGVINRFADKCGRVTLAVVPSNGYILSDKLPYNTVAYPDNEVYSAFCAELSSNVSLCDLRPEYQSLTAAGKQLYYRTDHHWTSEGAYTAYGRLCAMLGTNAAAHDKFDISCYGDFYGTTYSASGYYLTRPDTLEIWRDKSLEGNVRVSISEGTATAEYDSMYFDKHLHEGDKYPVFLDGNHSVVTIESKKADSDKTLLIVKDSFAHCIAPFFAENYSKVIMVDPRYYRLPISELAQSEHADDILILYGMNNFLTDTNFAVIK